MSQDGLAIHVSRIHQFRRHNVALWHLDEQFQDLFDNHDFEFSLYRDSVYLIVLWFNTPHTGISLTCLQKSQNAERAAVRTTVKWILMDLKQWLPRSDYKRSLKCLQAPCRKIILATLQLKIFETAFALTKYRRISA